jgi:hypothetical protein
MFQVGTEADGLIVVEIGERIDSEAMRAGLELLFRATRGRRDAPMLYRIRNLEMPTAGALMVELGQIPQLFGLIRTLGKIAVLADRDWLRRAAEIEGGLIPGLTIRAFEPGDEAAARAWLSGAEPAAPDS